MSTGGYTIQSLQTHRFLFTDGHEQSGSKVQMVTSLTGNDLNKIVKAVISLFDNNTHHLHGYRSSPQVVHSKVTYFPALY